MKTVMDNQCVQFVSCHNILRMTDRGMRGLWSRSRGWWSARSHSKLLVSVSNTLVSLTSLTFTDDHIGLYTCVYAYEAIYTIAYNTGV